MPCITRCNASILRFTPSKAATGEDKAPVRQLGQQLGLERLDDNLCSDDDSITSLKVVGKSREGEYIPYTNKRLNWHTDGYYNRPDRQIRGVILHCVQPAAAGGESALMDHEIAYIQLRDENPDIYTGAHGGGCHDHSAEYSERRRDPPRAGWSGFFCRCGRSSAYALFGTGPQYRLEERFNHTGGSRMPAELVSAGFALYISPPAEIRSGCPQ